MSWPSLFAKRLRTLICRRRFEADMAEELQAHLEMQAAANRAAGMDADEAHFAARRQFGGVDQIKETARAQRGWVWLEQLGKDFRFALRSLRRTPGFTTVAILTLVLSTGATTAIFSLVHGLLLRPLPIADQTGAVLISESTRQNPSMSVAYPNFVDWNERQHSFTALGAVRTQDVNITNRGDPERVSGAMVSHDFFAALGVPPGQGRFFRVTEDQPGAARTVLIRASLCRRHFGDPAGALGQTLALDGQSYTVIGILPEAFAFPANATEVWLPLGLWADDYRNRRQHPGLRVIGCLRPGANLDSARADLTAIADQLAREYPDSNRGNGVQLQPLTDYLFKDVRPAMAVLSGAVACVLLIACANVAGLLLVRATGRRREFAIRVALGAGRGRFVRMLLVESLVLGLAGALGGFLVSFGLVDAIKSVLPAATPRLAQVGVDTTVLAFSTIVGVVTGLLLGLLPAWRASRPDLAGELAQASRNVSPGAQHGRAVLVAGEFALTVVLLLGAG
ncbi:MAG TPA: ABC transporter permease, partial [Opitutaceae bacterium]|nr:ABC transporter permease [Opitutaceae bacterium]